MRIGERLMKYKLVAVASLVLSVISLVCAATSERRARMAAERVFANGRAELERQITERVRAELASKIVPTAYTVPGGRRSPTHREPEMGLWHPMIPPKRVD